MHSARELCGVADPGYLLAALAAYWSWRDPSDADRIDAVADSLLGGVEQPLQAWRAARRCAWRIGDRGDPARFGRGGGDSIGSPTMTCTLRG